MTIATEEIVFRDQHLRPVWEKVQEGARLDREDGLAVLQSRDLTAIGKMADFAKRRMSSDDVLFVVNRQINPTNLCVLDCTFCDFAARPGDPHAYEMRIEEILAKLSSELSEVHIVGGLHPQWKFEDYVRIVEAIHRAYPEIQIKAWTAVEIDWFARIAKMDVVDVLARMREAGVVALPGGGAEVFSERVRQATFKHKMGAERWLEIHRIAHRMGIPSNATLLYGHIETYAERIEHMLRLREAQDETPGFLSFIPLALQPGNTGLAERQASPLEDLRTVAASRLMLDNFPHVKSYWIMLGEETASMALHFGASDLDGTIGEERIAHYAQAKSAVGLAREKLVEMIRDAGKRPVERDALYNVVRVWE
ncbi:MAG TPA: aminofutalosine synthase MqnE [Vicinamibacteria bacterium]